MTLCVPLHLLLFLKHPFNIFQCSVQNEMNALLLAHAFFLAGLFRISSHRLRKNFFKRYFQEGEL